MRWLKARAEATLEDFERLARADLEQLVRRKADSFWYGVFQGFVSSLFFVMFSAVVVPGESYGPC
jgi:hypothetical protein